MKHFYALRGFQSLFVAVLLLSAAEASAQTVGVSLAELEAPFSDGLVSEGDAAHGHHLFDIAEAQGEAKI